MFGQEKDAVSAEDLERPGSFTVTMTLLHRSFIKSYRDVVAYGIRIVMYLGLALMMGTVWLRIHTSQDYIQPFVNAIVSSSLRAFLTIAYHLYTVLRLSIHVLHGRRIRTSIFRGSSHLCQRTS